MQDSNNDVNALLAVITGPLGTTDQIDTKEQAVYRLAELYARQGY